MKRLLPLSLEWKTVLPQFSKYALIGTFTNLMGYAVYLLITSQGFSPKATVSVLYVVGALINFLANRRFTFGHDGHLGRAGARYLWAQLAGYFMNILILVLFVDWLGFSHQYAQAAAIIVVAILLFVLSRFFVFVPDKSKRVESL